MQFKEISKESYITYKVDVEYLITSNQKEYKPSKTFDSIDEVIEYIKKIKTEFKKLSEIYKSYKITVHKHRTSESTYAVMDDS